MQPADLRAARDRLRLRPVPALPARRVLLVRRTGSPADARDRALVVELRRLGQAVVDLDVARHRAVLVPAADGGPARLDLEPVAALLRRHAPHLVLVAGDAWHLTPAAGDTVREGGAVVERLAPSGHPGAAADGGDGLHVLPPAVSRSELLLDPPPSPARVAEVLGAAADGDAEVVDRLAEAGLLETGLAELLRSLPAPARAADGPVRSVLLSGYYGAGNRGDELLLAVLLDHLQARVPGFQPVVAASNAAAVEAEHGAQAFSRADLDESERYAALATGMILGPGGHWHDHSIQLAGGAAGLVRGARVSPGHMAQLPLLVAAHGGQVHAAGLGVGPLSDPSARAAVRLTGRIAASVSVRDAESAALLEPMPTEWDAPVRLAPDLVYGLPLPAPEAADRPPFLAVNLRPWTDAPEHRRTLVDTVAAVAREHGLGIVGVPMQRTDVAPLQELVDAAGDDVPVEVLPADLPLAGLLGVLGQARVLVAMRLHASLLRHRLRGPAVGLVYDPKVGSHFAQLGRAHAALPLDAEPAALRAALEAALAEESLSAAVTRRLAELEDGARAELDRLAEALAAAPARRLDPGWADHPAPPPPAPRTPPAPSTAASPAAPAAPEAPATPPAPTEPPADRPAVADRAPAPPGLSGLRARAQAGRARVRAAVRWRVRRARRAWDARGR